MSDNVTATELAGFASWGVPLLSAIGGAVVGFILKLLLDKSQEKKNRRQEALKTHLEEINNIVVAKIYDMCLCLKIDNNQLMFGMGAPVMNQYTFEKDEYYHSFKAHFPQKVGEWEKLKSEAIDLKKYVDIVSNGPNRNPPDIYKNARERINEELFSLNSKFNSYGRNLAKEIKDIIKYQDEKKFKYLKKCPICKKF